MKNKVYYLIKMADDQKRIFKQKTLNTTLLEAVYKGDLEKVKKQIANGAHHDTQCQISFVSPTHIAAYHGSVSILEELLEKGAELKTRDFRGLQPHHMAAFRNKSLKCLKIILDKQNDLIDSPVILEKTKTTLKDDLSDSYGHNHNDLINLVREQIEEGATALYIATKHGLAEVVRELLERNAKVTDEILDLAKTIKKTENEIYIMIKAAHEKHLKMGPLQMAVFKGNVEYVKQCLEEMENEDQIDNTLLHLAVQNKLKNESNKNDYTDILVMLLDTIGINNINHKEENDKTPLFLATEGKWMDDMYWLLNNKADESIKCHKGETVFHVAARNKDYNILKYLLEMKPNSKALQLMDDEGYTPLFRAIKTGCPNCVQALLETSFDHDYKLTLQGQECTILHAAIESSWNRDKILQRILEYLIKKNSPESISILNETNSEGLTAVDLAAKKGEARCLDVLLQYDNINVVPINIDKKQNHDTALHHVAKQGYFLCLEKLLDRCEDVIDMLDSNNLTALIYAARGGHNKCVKLLLKKGANLAIKDPCVNRTAVDVIMSNVSRAPELIDDLLDSFIVPNRNAQAVDVTKEALQENNKKTSDQEKIPLLHSINNADHSNTSTLNPSLNQVVVNIGVSDAPTTVTTKASPENNNNQINNKIPNQEKKHIQNNSDNNDLYKIHMVNLDYTCLVAGSRQLEVIEAVNECKYDKLKQKFFVHPLVKTFLIHKWKQINNLFITLLIVYLIHAISVTSFAIFTTVYPQLIASFIFLIFTLLTIVPVTLVEIVTWLQDANIYSRFETYIKWTGILLTVIFSVVSIFWQNSYFASVTVLFSWMELLLFMAMSCNGGFYILLFFKVAKHVFQVLSFFIFLILGFALSFFILFNGRKPFPDPFSSFGAVVAMISELNYDGAFEKETDSILIILGHILFIIFYVLVVMVMMNLIIGLSVNIVTEHEGKCKHLAMQGSFLSLVDKFFWDGETNNFIIWLRNFVHLENKPSKGKEQFNSLTIFPNQPSKDNVLEKELIFEVMEIVNNKTKRFRPENMVQKIDKMGERVDEVNDFVHRRQ